MKRKPYKEDLLVVSFKKVWYEAEKSLYVPLLIVGKRDDGQYVLQECLGEDYNEYAKLFAGYILNSNSEDPFCNLKYFPAENKMTNDRYLTPGSKELYTELASCYNGNINGYGQRDIAKWMRRNARTVAEIRMKRATDKKEYDMISSGVDYTYLIHDPNAQRYKIGHSKNPFKRLASFCNPDLVLCYICPKNIEQTLHREYTWKRVKGSEWFNLTNYDILNIVRKYKFEKVH